MSTRNRIIILLLSFVTISYASFAYKSKIIGVGFGYTAYAIDLDEDGF